MNLALASAVHRHFFSRESLESGMETAREDILKSKIIERDTQEKKKKKKEVEKKKKEVMESEKGQAAYKKYANAQVPEVSVRDDSRGPLSPILDDVLLFLKLCFQNHLKMNEDFPDHFIFRFLQWVSSSNQKTCSCFQFGFYIL